MCVTPIAERCCPHPANAACCQFLFVTGRGQPEKCVSSFALDGTQALGYKGCQYLHSLFAAAAVCRIVTLPN
jgi:hypothetical protein